jgi:hypothetical protein
VQAHGGGLSLQAARETAGAVFVVTLPLDAIDRISSDLTESRPTAAAQQSDAKDPTTRGFKVIANAP